MQLSLQLNEPETARLVRDRLAAVQGSVRDLQRHDPEAQLIKSIISSITRDEVSGPAFQLLSAVYGPNWSSLAVAEHGRVLSCIRFVTNAGDKAAYIIETAGMVVRERGAIELGFLAERTVADATRWLRRLRGVGPKCAAATLNFSSLRMRTFAVDTHVLRVSKRLGLVPEKANSDKAHRLLMALMPDSFDSDDLYELHWLMKTQGQTVCTFASPRCSICALSELCASRHAERSINGFIKI